MIQAAASIFARNKTAAGLRCGIACGRAQSERAGFSLVEIVAVLCILGLLASGGMLMLTGQLRLAQRRAAASEFIDLHRRAVRQSNAAPLKLELDLVQHTVKLAETGQQIAIDGLKTLVTGGAVLESGLQTIQYAEGGSRSYAVLLGSEASGRWLVICGPTGRVESYAADKIDAQQFAQGQANWDHLD